jgi:CRISPR system Cascade subunit CasD
MSVLLLQLAAPLQAWGSSSKFTRRSTERQPTKSAIIGLIAAAQGRKRADSIDDLCALNYGVRVDQAGELLKDYHTARMLTGKAHMFLSDRYYLADALFIVGLQASDEGLLRDIEWAIKHPQFPLFLGRRSCPPSEPLSLGIRKGVDLLDALRDEPWHANEWYCKKLYYTGGRASDVRLEIVCDADMSTHGAYLQKDNPVSFNQMNRQHSYRSITHKYATVPNPVSQKQGEQALVETETEHDALGALEVSDVSFTG